MYLNTSYILIELGPNGEIFFAAPMGVSQMHNFDKHEIKIEKTNSRKEPPNDSYFIASLLFFFTGLAGALPLHFFLVANDVSI